MPRRYNKRKRSHSNRGPPWSSSPSSRRWSDASSASSYPSSPQSGSDFPALDELISTFDDDGNDNNTSNETELQPLILLCTGTAQIVGLRYYTGVAHPGEYVRLVREPRNPYDRNAVRVDNIHGEQVGHVKATMAVCLAPIMDDMGKYGVCKIDGSIPRPAGTYVMPLTLELYGTDVGDDDVGRRSSVLVQSLRRHGISVTVPEFSSRVIGGGGRGPANIKPSQQQQAIETRTTIIEDWKSQKELDNIFDKQKSLIEHLPSITPPTQIKSILLPHQLAGLSWLHHRETSSNQGKHLFYKQVIERGKTVWLSEITNASQLKEPKQVKGGLLCDDMGMGKSLMTLALIFKNPPEGFVHAEGSNGSVSAEGGSSHSRQEEEKQMPSSSLRNLVKGQQHVVSTANPTTSSTFLDTSTAESTKGGKNEHTATVSEPTTTTISTTMTTTSVATPRQSNIELPSIITPPPLHTTFTPIFTHDTSSNKPNKTSVRNLPITTLRSLLSSPEITPPDENIHKMKKKDLIERCIEALNEGILSPETFWSFTTPPHKDTNNNTASRDMMGVTTNRSMSGQSIPIHPLAGVEPRPCCSSAAVASSSVSTSAVGTTSKKSSLCDNTSTMSSSGKCRTNLIVCPVSVMSNWVEQVHEHLKDNVLTVELYQGTDRYSLLPKVQANEVDILLVSYQTLAADYHLKFDSNEKKTPPKKRTSANIRILSIFNIHFHRIILDEAHMIRNANTRASRACLKLQSTYKLGLTGTPLQNKPDDIRPLLAFLGLEPFHQDDVFRRAISQPIRNGDDVGLTRLRTLMCHVALRRTKESAGIKLKDRSVQVCSVAFPDGSQHKRIYDTLFHSAQEAFGAMLRGGEEDALKEYMSILESLLRIRQACCSSLLIPPDRIKRAENVLDELKCRSDENGAMIPLLSAEEGKKLLERLRCAFSQDAEETTKKGAGGDTSVVGGDTSVVVDGSSSVAPECAICLGEFDPEHAIILRRCSHIFCCDCIARVASMTNRSCPLCRGIFRKCDVVKMSAASMAALKGPRAEEAHVLTTDSRRDCSSPKIEALLQSIGQMEPDEKGVVFSQFTSFLDIIEQKLTDAGHVCTRIDGSMRASNRIRAMRSFNSDEEGSPRFILCSLLAAGTGINLTRGNHVYLMDLWWNKAAEDQAMDRVHRIGQTRNVRIVKFVIEGSVEERIFKMQDAKAAMGKGTMEKLSPEEMRQAKISALKDLFQLS